eukprot:8107917-Heterocapsa_arctica.AAC.1
MDNDMSVAEEIEILNWIENNETMKEAAKQKFDTELLTETREITPSGIHLGAIIFDQLIGGHIAFKNGKNIFNLKANSSLNWVPWGKIV